MLETGKKGGGAIVELSNCYMQPCTKNTFLVRTKDTFHTGIKK